jgi:hypothetical protein
MRRRTLARIGGVSTGVDARGLEPRPHGCQQHFSTQPFDLYFAGARVLEVFQIGVVQGNITLSVGVLSYAGQLNFDVVADADAVPDVDSFSDGLSDALNRLGAG